jgi:hypothetical protein
MKDRFQVFYVLRIYVCMYSFHVGGHWWLVLLWQLSSEMIDHLLSSILALGIWLLPGACSDSLAADLSE